jgi:hypothetical protein
MKIGWLAFGDHGVHNDGTPLLSPDCVSVAEIEEQAEYLKSQLMPPWIGQSANFRIETIPLPAISF